MFGGKGWGSWKGMGANSNFYRPGVGYNNYGYSAPIMAGLTGGYPLREQLNVAPFMMSGYTGTPYASNPNDGWSLPAAYNQNQVAPVQQTQLSGYDSYTQLPPTKQQQQVVNPILDPYSGGTKGTTGNKLTTTTKK